MKNLVATIFVFCHLFILGANTYAGDLEVEQLNAMVKAKTIAYHQRDQLSKIKEVPARWDAGDKTLFGVFVASGAAAYYIYTSGDCSSFVPCALSIVGTVASSICSTVTGICLACDSEKICKEINKENIENAKHQKLARVLLSAFIYEEKDRNISLAESSPIVDMIQRYLDQKCVALNAADIAHRIRAAVYAGYFLPANKLDVADYTDSLGIWAAFSPEELIKELVAVDDRNFFEKAQHSNKALLQRIDLIKKTRDNVTKPKDL